MRLSPPDAGAASFAAGSTMCGGGPSAVVPEDELRHAARLGLTLDLVSQSPDDFCAALELLDLGDLDVHPDPAAHGQRRGEADLVEPVVEDHAEALDHAHRPEQTGRHAEGEEAVLDGRPEGTLRGPLGVDVDPLLVAGQPGERRDLLLHDRLPVADADLLSDVGLEPLQT